MSRLMSLFANIAKTKKLPYYFDLPGPKPVKVCVDEYQECHMDAVVKIREEAGSEGDGFSIEDDYSYLEEGIRRKDPRFKGYVMTDMEKLELMGARIFFPTLLCRSEAPVMTGGMVLVHKNYRAMGLAAFSGHLQHDQYHGMASRINVIANTVKPAVRTGSVFYGLIPMSADLAGKGRFPDLLVMQHWSEPHEKAKAYEMPPLLDRDYLEPRLPMFGRSSLAADLPPLSHHVFGDITITPADNSELWLIQQKIREMAVQGDAFGLDEFTADGVYNEKIVRNCSYLVVRKQSSGEMLGMVLTGDAGLCRSPSRDLVAGTVVVFQPYRGQGLGEQLLAWCEDMWRASGCRYVVTDILAHNMPGNNLMAKRGYSITGTVPWSTIHNGRYVSSSIVWKELAEE